MSKFSEYPLWDMYSQYDWYYKELINYFINRFHAITQRFENTTRFLDIHENNKNGFSYEHASILRDIGSVFSSVMDLILTEIKWPKKGKYYTITHYREYLTTTIVDIENVVCRIGAEKKKAKFILPFENFKNKIPEWWTGFTSIKHSDIMHRSRGNLSNVLYAYCALAALYRLVYPHDPRENLFGLIIQNISAHPGFTPLLEDKYPLPD